MADYKSIAGRIKSEAFDGVSVEAQEVLDISKNKKQSQINAETDTTLANHASAIQGLNSQNYETYTATDQTTAETDVLPAEGSEDTIYRLGNWDGTQYDVTCYSEYSWNDSAYVHISTKTQIGEVFDISAYHATGGTLAIYSDLNDALNGANGGVPQSLRRGGMQISFVQSSDNKYVQYRLMSQTFSTTESDWQGVDDVPTAGSENLVKSGGVEREISLLHNEIGDNVDYSYLKIVGGGYIMNGGEGITGSSTSDLIKFLPVCNGETYKYEGNSGLVPAVYGYNSPEFNNPVQLVRNTGNETKIVTFEIPSGVNFICAWSRNSTHPTTPSELKLFLISNDGLRQELTGIRDELTLTNDKVNLLVEDINGKADHTTQLNYGSNRTALDGDILQNEEFQIKINSVGCALKKLLFIIYDTANTTSGNYKWISFLLSGNSSVFTLKNSVSSEYIGSHSANADFVAKYIRVYKIANATLDEGEEWSIDATITSGFHSGLELRVENLEERPTIVVPPAYNGYSLPKNPTKLKILSIGNSFISGPMDVLAEWLSSVGVTEIEWCLVLKGSYSLEGYYNGISTNEKYSFVEMNNDNNFDNSFAIDATTGEHITSGETQINNLKNCILYQDWDIITFQQVSTYSGMWSSVEPYLNPLIKFARYWCKNSGVKIVWHQTWAAANDCTEKLQYYNNSQEEMWEGIVNVTKKVIENCNLDLIVPSGTVVQNLRNVPDEFWQTASALVARDFMVQSDGYHPAAISKYAICAAWIQQIILAVFGGTIKDKEFTYQTNITGKYAKVCVQSALKAIGDRFTASEYSANDQ